MPMVWRILYTLHKINQKHTLTIGILKLAVVFRLRTDGSSRFVLQRRTNASILHFKTTQNEDEWRSRFFYVRRDSIPDGPLLLKWLVKATKIENLIPERNDSDIRIEALLELEEGEKTFCIDSTVPKSSAISEHSQASMSNSTQFGLSDFGKYMSVKSEKTCPASIIKPRDFPLRSASKSSKKRKPSEPIEPKTFGESSFIEAFQKL